MLFLVSMLSVHLLPYLGSLDDTYGEAFKLFATRLRGLLAMVGVTPFMHFGGNDFGWMYTTSSGTRIVHNTDQDWIRVANNNNLVAPDQANSWLRSPQPCDSFVLPFVSICVKWYH